ncbi:MAG: hypothetical protein ACJ77K_01475 [Bacteroidia bacterium]
MRKVLFGTFITVLLAGGAYWFIQTKRARTPIPDGINAIPSDAALIFESRNSRSAWKKISQTNIMWEELLGTETAQDLNAQALSIDSALQLNPSVYGILDEHPVYVSLHPGEKRTGVLYVFSLPDLTWQTPVEEYFETTANHGKPIYTAEYIGDARIGVLQLRDERLLYFAFSSGILVMSTTDELLRNSLKQLQSGTSIAKDPAFTKVISSSGKNVDANVYVNYKQFPILAKTQMQEFGHGIDGLSDFAAYSGWDITIKPNELSLNGFTTPLPKGYLNLFSTQKPQEVELPAIAPANTSEMLYFGLSDVKAFYSDNLIYQAEKNKDHFVPAKDDESALVELLESEMAIIVTDAAANDIDENRFVVLRASNGEQMTDVLQSLAEESGKGKRPDTASYRHHPLGPTNTGALLSHLFNRVLPGELYFSTINDYIVFGSSRDALKTFIDSYEDHHVLGTDKNYKAFADNLSGETNIFLYSSIARSEDFYTQWVDRDLATEIHLQKELLKKFQAVGVQFSSGNRTFYSNIFLRYNPEQKQETGTIWETKLDTTVSSRPYLLTNHNTKAKEVFIQDDANKIYLISNTGKIIWTKQLPEKIMSDVMQIDVLKNDKLQMIFNTRSCIYMYDRNGNEMNGFPLKLRSPATNPISVIDYENNRDYRIFIATENKRIVCYKTNGEQVTAFAFDKTKEPVYLPIQYFNASNKDHLCAVDQQGNIYILDRHGEIRVAMKEQMPQGIREFFAEPGHDYNHSFLVAADTLGNVTRLSLAGKKEITTVKEFDSSPFFELRDINNDKTKEFIFLTRNELDVFSPDKTLLFKYEFPGTISQPPLYFTSPDNTGMIGVVSDLTNELFLFNENGTLCKTFPLNGKTPFSIGDMNNDGHLNLATGNAENSIFVYQLK